MSKRSNRRILKGLGLPATPGSLQELALTHRSFAFEQPEPTRHNERLEFLGDAVLETVVTDLIYRRYPHFAEGRMARLRAAVVNTNALAELAGSLGLGDHIRLGRGEEASGGNAKPSLLSDTFEALVGAAYLDFGMPHVMEVLGGAFAPLLEKARTEGDYDTKGSLQEAVAKANGSRPTYRVAASGPDHDKRFVAHVFIDEELYGSGDGRSKREAELNAAREALDRFEEGPQDAPRGRGRDARAS